MSAEITWTAFDDEVRKFAGDEPTKSGWFDRTFGGDGGNVVPGGSKGPYRHMPPLIADTVKLRDDGSFVSGIQRPSSPPTRGLSPTAFEHSRARRRKTPLRRALEKDPPLRRTQEALNDASAAIRRATTPEPPRPAPPLSTRSDK
jgi:hypothetical protein